MSIQDLNTQQILRLLGKLGDASLILATLAGKSKPVMAVTLALKAIQIGADVYHEVLTSGENPNSLFFDWIELAKPFKPVFEKHSTNIQSVGKNGLDEWFIANIEGVTVGWNSDSLGISYIYCKEEDHLRLLEVCRKFLWGLYKTENLTLSGISPEDDIPFSDSGLVETDFMVNTSKRVSKFLKKGSSRGMLISGPPGTGKSTCASALIKSLNLSSIRIPLESLEVNTYIGNDTKMGAIESIITSMQPDVLVLNDLDRADESTQNWMLDILERLRGFTKLIIVTANRPEKLDKALIRVGRLDDHIEVPPLDHASVNALLGSYTEHFEIMRHWPIGFIKDYVYRVETLGLEEADKEVAGLDKRVKEQVS